MALRNVFLLNAGALVSLIAFMGSIADASDKAAFGPKDFLVGFSFFVAGLALAVGSMLLAYINLQFHAQSNADAGALANAIMEVLSFSVAFV